MSGATFTSQAYAQSLQSAIDKLAELQGEATHEEVTWVFSNVDMFADAKRFKKALKL